MNVGNAVSGVPSAGSESVVNLALHVVYGTDGLADILR